MSTRLNPAYASALFALRRDIVNGCDPATAELLMDRVQDLADQLMRGTAPLVRVPLSVCQAELEAEKALAGEPLGDFVALDLPSDVDVSGLLLDCEPAHSGFRDQRRAS